MKGNMKEMTAESECRIENKELLKDLHYKTKSWCRGYISRKEGAYLCEYSGRYGEGYVMHIPSWHSTTYHHVIYYVKGE